jgi:hypothetical protein
MLVQRVIDDNGRTMAARWDGDERGEGTGDAAQLVPGASQLVAAFNEPTWVAEQPEAHLLPHVAAWAEQNRDLALTGAHPDSAGAYVLDFEWHAATGSVGAVRAAVFALVGCFAEAATYIRQRRVASGDAPSSINLQFEVGTGELAPDASFHPHGHVVLINVTGVVQRPMTPPL